jgi:hypothetical protein
MSWEMGPNIGRTVAVVVIALSKDAVLFKGIRKTLEALELNVPEKVTVSYANPG